ncbi:MAG: hypothetical protein NZ873_02275, partial [Crenarchaeota archaeon]|nr:hypothetical protein [Thermoproteota archaeon]MDW8034348.1 hypothetical protein [Nitrososphaerota archaeon]
GLKQVKPVVEVDLLSDKQMDEVIGILNISGFDAIMLSFSYGLRGIRDEEISLLKEIPKGITLEACCRVGSIKEAIKLVESGIRKICTVDYKVILESFMEK